ncbi:5-methylcytosine restriction system component- like protein [Haliangium ochraceum]|uniref:5-methylcytosine restriction system component-like protein n=1 Tax=Haliangium ochraceum (strain DSM 14365 / JCM 11303 / SMP-2) TaxID=502025 RepID=D0LPM4_HALO1|nr:5-methylcytosine restriction system component- like protein [Haliangium ochraceum]ACY15387.1 5-methylcytosine restriction system component- like protein [Haliangium ochraceum DSM 14365]
MNHVQVYENEAFTVTRKQEAALKRVLGGRLRQVDRRRARIWGVAGHVRLDNGEIWHVRSRKAGAACLLTWLAYADPGLAALRLLRPLPETTREGDLGPLVARVFCAATWHAIQTSGLLRAYHRQSVRSSMIRGRIDFPRLVHAGGDLSRTPCIVFSRLPQTPLNRLLAAAVAQIRRDPVLRASAGADLPPLATALADVSPHLDRALLSARIPLSRLEQPFAASHALACLILRSAGLASGSEHEGAGFLVDLANLFERAVARAFRDAPFAAEAKWRVQLLREAPSTPSTQGSSMELDVFLPDVRGQRVVVDAKYKTRVTTGNLQQMITYCVASGTHQAVLVFPAGHLTDRRAHVLVPHRGPPAYRIHLVEFELTQTDLAGWRDAGRRLADAVVHAVSPTAPATAI